MKNLYKIAKFIKADNLSQWDNDDNDFLRRAIAAEVDAINLYENQAEKSTNEAVTKLLLHLAKEEKEHLAELTQLLDQLDSEQNEVNQKIEQEGIEHE